MILKKTRYFLALIPFIALISLYEIVPLTNLIVKSFQSSTGTGFSLEQYATIFSKAIYKRAIINSLKVSIVSSVVGIIVAFFGAKAIHSVGGRLKNFFTLILNVTSNFSGVPLAFSFMLLLGNSGIIIAIARQLGWEAIANFDLYSSRGLILIYVYFQVPLATLLIIPALHGIRKEWLEAAMSLKASPAYFWIHVGIPVLVPSIMGTFSTLFSNALAGYATAYALMSSNYALLPISIANMYTGDIVVRKELGGALSVIVISFMIINIYLNRFIVVKTCRFAGDASQHAEE
jgi:putative spermidine/putrescine transport system permease protein